MYHIVAELTVYSIKGKMAQLLFCFLFSIFGSFLFSFFFNYKIKMLVNFFFAFKKNIYF